MKKRNKEFVGVIGSIILCGVLIYGITIMKNTRQASKDESLGSKKKIYLITKGKDSNFWKVVHSGAKAASTEYNFELTYIAPDNEEDYETQNKLIGQAVEEGADAIVFSAIDYEKNAEPIDAAAEKGIKIVNIDSEVNSDARYCYIGTDNFKAGQLAGEAALEQTGKDAKVGIVGFMQSTQNGKSREEGVRDILENENNNYIAEAIHVPSSVEDTKEATKKMLKEHPEMNCIIALNEILSVGVGMAVQELNQKNEVDVIAFDNNVRSVSMLETGSVDALVVQVPYAMGYLGVEEAYHALNGEKTEPTIDTICKVVTKKDMYAADNQRLLFGFE